MTTTDWFNHPQYIPDEKRIVSEQEAVYALREGWKNVYNEYPSDNSLAILYAQTCLETGRFKVGFYNNNFGNIKADLNYKNLGGEHYFTMFKAGEIFNGKEEIFHPPHIQTHFRAYKTLIKGAEDYILFLSKRTRYQSAWKELMKGRPKEYSYALSANGYYTANREKYTAGVVRLFEEFHRRKDELMSWQPIEDQEEKIDTIPVPANERVDKITTIPPPSNESKKEVIIPPPPSIPNIKEVEEEETPDFKEHNKKGIGLVILAVIVGGITSMIQGCENILSSLF